MTEPTYYRIKLDSYSAKAYACMGKFFFGTMEDIGAFVNSIQNHSNPSPDFEEAAAYLPWAYYKTIRGEWDSEVDGESPFTPVELISTSTALYNLDDWKHLCTWRWPHNWHCAFVIRTCRWFRAGRRYYRATKARFVQLRDQGKPAAWPQDQHMFWGFPKVLQKDMPMYEHQLMVLDEEFRQRRQAVTDWITFERNPLHDFNLNWTP